MGRTVIPVRMSEAEDSPPKVLIKPVSVILGIVSGLGIAVLLQQYAVAALTPTLLMLMAVLGALVFGVVIPTVMMRMYAAKALAKEASP